MGFCEPSQGPAQTAGDSQGTDTVTSPLGSGAREQSIATHSQQKARGTHLEAILKPGSCHVVLADSAGQLSGVPLQHSHRCQLLVEVTARDWAGTEGGKGAKCVL